MKVKTRNKRLSVIAIKPEDGWAYVAESKKIFLVRPPYLTSALVETDQREVEIAYCDHGFEIPEDDLKKTYFSSWDLLFKEVRARLIARRKAIGQQEPSPAASIKILLSMPPSGIKAGFDLIEKKFIPCGEFERAERLLEKLTNAEAVRLNHDLERQLNKLRDKCNKEQSKSVSKNGCLLLGITIKMQRNIEMDDYKLKKECHFSVLIA